MKQVFKYASLLFVAGALLVTSCSKKKDDATVTPEDPATTTPSSPAVCQTSAKILYVQIDASTKDGAKGFTSAYSCAASTTDTIYLDLKVKGTADKLYMKKVNEDGAVTKFDNISVFAPAVGKNGGNKTEDGNTITTGAGYSYQIPAKDASNTTINYKEKALLVKIPVSKRPTGAKYDIYTFWITSNTGDFDNYNKKNTFGPITVTLVYGTDKPVVSTQSSIKLGDQDATEASYVTSSPSGISTLSGASLFVATDSDAEKTNTLNAVDINFVTLSTDGSSCTTSTTPYFIGVGLRSVINGTNSCLSNTQGTNITKFGKVTLSKAFANMTAADISALTTPTANKILVEEGADYVYLTQDGRKGIIHASGLTAAPKANVSVDVKVVVQ